MQVSSSASYIDQQKFMQVADWLVVAVAVSLPWSTSATGILVVLWLVALVPTLTWPEVRRELVNPVGGLPVLLLVLGIVGMAWSDASWHERWGGLTGFVKLATVPLLIAQFRRSDGAHRVFIGFLIAGVALLVASYAVTIWPQLPKNGSSVPVKSYILQSLIFIVCAAVLVDLALAELRLRRWVYAVALGVLLVAFLYNVLFVVTGRTALVIAAVLLPLYGFWKSSWKGLLVASATGLVIAGAVGFTSSYLRQRVSGVYVEAKQSEEHHKDTSTGERISFWRYSVHFIRHSPLIGRGTGTIAEQFETAAEGRRGVKGIATTNPHNMTFAVGIQLGLLGIGVLWAMWLFQFFFFYRGSGLLAWVGLVIVTQNAVGSLFNSFTFDFTEGWIYVVGLGVVAGAFLRQSDAEERAAIERASGAPASA
jgi:O-antigen ligase